MEIILAKSAGFCYGVANAVKKASELVQENQQLQQKKIIKSLGPIIHNETIINELKEAGLEVIDFPHEANKGEQVVIRAHGVGEKIYQQLNELKADVIDVTCPYVMKIHELVREKSQENYVIIVVGDIDHPEVKGICGWVDGPNWVVINPEELDNENILRAYNESKGLCLVSQTTLTQEKWEKVLNFARIKFKNVLKFDTICKATVQRQTEAIELAKKVEAMVVIGSRTSSNTLKLEEVCKMHCKRTFLVEGPDQLIPKAFKYINKIGITAGASTPGKVIKEVIGKMSEMQSNPSTESFEELLEQYSGEVRSGRTTKGTVSNITTEKIYVDLGGKFEGEIPASQYEEGDLPAIGEVIDVRVNRISEKDSAIHLSRSTDRFAKTAKRFTELMEAGEPVSAKVERAVRGGAIARTEAGEVFIPLPLLSDRYVEKADDFVGKQIMVKIVSVDEKRRSVKASAREFARAEKAKAEEELWSRLEVGSIVVGTVKNFTDFRAFIDLGGIDGSIHVSELSWNRIKHPSEVLTIADKVEVKILDIDREKKRVSLQLKKDEENPWFGAEEKYALDNIVTGRVARIVPFGAFIQLAPGVDGLVHISQISDFRLAKVEEVLKIDDEIEGKIIEVDIPSQKISISIREVCPINPPERIAEAEARQKERDDRENERVKKSEDRRTAFEEKAAKKAVFDAEKTNYNAKKVARPVAPKSHVEELTNTIGDLSALANMFKNDNTDKDDKDSE